MNALNTIITIEQIALGKLVPSKGNVRRTNRGERIEELAASIAAHGLLQNLTVRPVDGDKYEVIAGGRRLAAMKLLVKQKRWAKDAIVPCVVAAEGNVTEISLAENALQCPMHPADQYEAFAALHRQDMTAEDIAARFGVTPNVVTQRLRLGAVSPKLLDIYRSGDMNLEQLSAFCITDDHALQQRVWKGLGYHRTRRAILDALSEGQVRMDDKRALFIGAETYTAAGGTSLHDLFDEDGGGYFTDVALLSRLVDEKLNAEAEKVRTEGWAWVEVGPSLDHGEVARMRRVYPVERQYTEEEQARLEDLSQRYEELRAALEDDESEEGEVALAAIEAEVEAIRGEDAYADSDKAAAGVIVTIGYDGELRVERAFVRREDDQRRRRPEAATGEASKATGASLPESLVAELTAHRTAALANELAQQPALALNTLTHALAAEAFFGCPRGVSCCEVSGKSLFHAPFAKGVIEARAMIAIEARQAEWQKQVPENPEELWGFVVGLSDGDRFSLLAHCVSLMIDVMRAPKSTGTNAAAADVIASALELDMTGYWQPTAESYFGRLAKPTMLAVIREAVSPEAAQTMEGMKKPDMALRAEKLIVGKNWLPDVLR